MMKRMMVLAYGVVSYLIFFGVFLYAIGFIGNFLVPVSLDGEATAPLGWAIGVNLTLLTVFAVQHSLMARPFFKRWLTRFIPEPMERSTYVLASNAAMIAMFVWWQPMGMVLWQMEESTAIALTYGLFALGWVTVFVSTCLINHFDLFGLRQVWLFFRGRPYTQLRFKMPGPYKYVRHPLYVGWLMVFWAAPTMTVGHMIFTVATTAYILIAIQLEERDLADAHGTSYLSYKNEVPMLIPRLLPNRRESDSGMQRV